MKKIILIASVFFVIGVQIGCKPRHSTSNQEEQTAIRNPISDIACADPSIVKYDGSYFIYATIDPWGGDELIVLESEDFVNWEQKHLNWPTKEACTSPTSNHNMVWAPSVIRAKDGKFYMFVSVGSEIWAGVSEHPLGPWKNLKADNSPLVKGDAIPGYHMIDAECFIDDDGQAYLYWGSGLEWVNGHCFVVKFNPDMAGFEGEPVDVTPPNYFEAPFMLKHDNKYYLMYSNGKCTNRTYEVRYAVGDTPYGPWTEGPGNPILSTSADSTILGPGHHAVFFENDQSYLLYHRIRDNKDELLRELVVDSLLFDKNGNILKVEPKGIQRFDSGNL